MTRKWSMIAAGVSIAVIVAFLSMRRAGHNHAPPETATRETSDPESMAPSAKPHRALGEPRLNEAEIAALDAGPAEALDEDADNLDLLVAWASRDPGAALAWCEAGDRHRTFESLLGAVATGILIKDGVGAMNRFVENHQNDSRIRPKNQGRLLPYVFFNLGREDTADTALKLLHESDASDLAGTMILGISGAQEQIRAIDYLESKGIPVSVSYWPFQETVDADPEYWADWADQRGSDMLVDILQSWNRRQPEAAEGWLRQRIPASDPRRQEIDERLSQ